MRGNRKLLAIASPDRHAMQTAVSKAILLAGHHGAEIEVLVYRDRATQDQASVGQLLDEFAAPAIARGLHIYATSIGGKSMREALFDYVREANPDWVVKTSEPRPLRRSPVPNLDWDLIHECPVPFLLSKSAGWAEAPVLLAVIEPLLDGISGPRLDPHTMDFSHGLARALDGTLHVVHAYQAAKLTNPPSMGNAVTYLPRAVLRLRADLLVMSTELASSRVLPLSGVTAARVAPLMQCDLLILKSRPTTGASSVTSNPRLLGKPKSAPGDAYRAAAQLSESASIGVLGP